MDWNLIFRLSFTIVAFGIAIYRFINLPNIETKGAVAADTIMAMLWGITSICSAIILYEQYAKV